MKKIRKIFNLLLLSAVCYLNYRVYSMDSGYSVKSVTDKLARTRQADSSEMQQILFFSQELIPQEETVTLEKKSTPSEKLQKKWQFVRDRQNALSLMIPEECELKAAFWDQNRVYLDFTGYSPEKRSLRELFIFKQLLDGNLCSTGQSVTVLFDGFPRNTRYLFND